MYSVYALGDPRDGQIRYIGIAQDVFKRYAQHLNRPHPNRMKNAWMDEVKATGVVPTLTIIESGIDNSAIYERERHWIQYYLDLKAPLTNIIHGPGARPHNDEKPPVKAWYAAGEAAKKLSENSDRPVLPSYVQKLASLGKIRIFKMHPRLVLYSKEDVDAYRVEPLRRREVKTVLHSTWRRCTNFPGHSSPPLQLLP
jgi:GIY-YIG catalytic domain